MDTGQTLAQALIDTMALLAPAFIVMISIEWVIGMFRRAS